MTSGSPQTVESWQHAVDATMNSLGSPTTTQCDPTIDLIDRGDWTNGQA